MAAGMTKVDEMIAQLVEAVSRLDETARETIQRMAAMLMVTFDAGGCVYVCGNGGSAADAQHIAGELVGRFRRHDRRPLPCVALTCDSSVLTALGNDFSFEQVFSLQVEALSREGDVLWALSTSGDSPNVVAAARTARQCGLKVMAMTGSGGGALAELAHVCFRAPGERTDLVQQIHQAVYHILCELVDEHFAKEA